MRIVLVSSLCLTVMLADGIVVAQSGFGPSTTIRRNTALNFAVYPGDFNNDGIVDLVGQEAQVTGEPHMVVALGKGDGTFGTPIRSGCTCGVLAVADFNKDGKADLLVFTPQQTNGSPTIAVLRGAGDGTFGAPRTVRQVENAAFGLASDIDGDGNMDIVFAYGDATGDHVAVAPGNGDLTFREPAIMTASAGASGATIADLNADGKKDIVVANHGAHSITIFLGQGAFLFSASEVPFDRQVNDVVAVDLNHDGKLDLALATSVDSDDDSWYPDGAVYVVAGNGNGTFAAPVSYRTAPGAWKIVAGDFTRDGIVDIATANRSGIFSEDCTREYAVKGFDSASILPGRSDGTLGAASSFALGDQLNPDDDRFRNSVRSLSVADVNGDGHPDLVASWGAVLLTTAPDANWAPSVNAGPDRAANPDRSVLLTATASDPDQDFLTYTWTDSGGEPVPHVPNPCVAPQRLGVHTYTVTVDDGHGHTASDSVVIDFGAPEPTIDVWAPGSSQVVASGVPFTIRWTVDDPNGRAYTYSVSYSADGVSSNVIPECASVSDTPSPIVGQRELQCTWNNPNPPSTHGVIEVKWFDSTTNTSGGGGAGPFAVRAAAPGDLPSQWQQRDVGTVDASGGATYADGVFTVKGSGADIWGTTDEFHFVYQQVTGDAEITTRVDSVQNVNPWTKAGVMMRASTNAGDAHASLFVSPQRGIAFQRRATPGGTSVTTTISSVTAPVWLRLTQRSGVTCAYYRKNATDGWTQILCHSIVRLSLHTSLAGLAVTSHADGTVATAKFSNVSGGEQLPWQGSAVGGDPGLSWSLDGTNYQLASRGADIWGTSDQFSFIWATVTGDATITARVRSVDNVNAWTKAGVMIRDSLAANAKHVDAFVTPGKGVSMQFRASTGGSSGNVRQIAGVAPGWLRLKRAGATITGQWSTDRVTWTTLGTLSNTTMASTVYVGIIVTSHNTAAAAAAKYDDLVVTRP